MHFNFSTNKLTIRNEDLYCLCSQLTWSLSQKLAKSPQELNQILINYFKNPYGDFEKDDYIANVIEEFVQQALIILGKKSVELYKLSRIEKLKIVKNIQYWIKNNCKKELENTVQQSYRDDKKRLCENIDQYKDKI